MAVASILLRAFGKEEEDMPSCLNALSTETDRQAKGIWEILPKQMSRTGKKTKGICACLFSSSKMEKGSGDGVAADSFLNAEHLQRDIQALPYVALFLRSYSTYSPFRFSAPCLNICCMRIQGTFYFPLPYTARGLFSYVTHF